MRSFHARAGMPQLRRSLLRQSNPSILTAGLLPKFGRTQPPCLEDDGEEGKPEVGPAMGESGENGRNFSSPNLSSLISGLDTLLGGDPQKKGGDEAICTQDCSAPQPPSCVNRPKLVFPFLLLHQEAQKIIEQFLL